MAEGDLLKHVEHVLANAKRAQREARIVVQGLARIRDVLEIPDEPGGTVHERRNRDITSD